MATTEDEMKARVFSDEEATKESMKISLRQYLTYRQKHGWTAQELLSEILQMIKESIQ